MKLVDVPQVKALTAREKLAFIDEIWCAVASELDEEELAPEEKQLLDERWNDYRTGKEHAISLQDFRDVMRALRK